jgi:hypothetical protein
VHPAWLEDLQHQLAAAAAAAAPSELLADADDSSNEVDSKLAHASWAAAAGAQLALQQQQQQQPQLQWQAPQQAPATAAAAVAPSHGPDDEAAAISQIEQQFLEQLMLDIEAKPLSSLTLPAGRQPPQWEQDALQELALQQQLDAALQRQQLATPQQGGHMWPQMPEMDAPAAPVWPGSSQQVLPTVGSWQRPCELSSSSFHSKRDLRARREQSSPLPALLPLQAGMVLPAAIAGERSV